MPHPAKIKAFLYLQTACVIFLIGITFLCNRTYGSSYLDAVSRSSPPLLFGPESLYVNTLTKQLSQKRQRLSIPHIIFVNARFFLPADEQIIIQEKLDQGSIVIIDGTEALTSETQQTSARIGGIGLGGSVVMIRKPPNNQPEYKHLIWGNLTESDIRTASGITHETIQKLALTTQQMLESWQQQYLHRATIKTAGKIPPWKPELSIPIEIRHIGFPCMVGSRYEGNNITGYSAWDEDLIDACNNNASVSLHYTVELIRSHYSKGSTHNAKYIRITMDPSSNGGAGWHLVEKPHHRHTWFESWANRETWYGPIADSYDITLEPLDPDIRLYHSIPTNHPKHSDVTHTTKIMVGVMLAMGLTTPSEEQSNHDDQATGANTDHDLDDGESDTETVHACCSTSHHEQAPVTQPQTTTSDQGRGPCCCGHSSGTTTDSSHDSNLGATGGPSSSSSDIAPLNEGAIETSGLESHSDQHSACCHTEESFTAAHPLLPSEDDEDEDKDESDAYDDLIDSGNPIHHTQTSFHASSIYPRKYSIPVYLSDINHSLTTSSSLFKHRAGKYRDMNSEQSFTYESKRAIAYQNYEYEVTNYANTHSHNTVSWRWSREFEKNASHWRTNNTCPLWCSDWFFSDNAFSAAAYAHFVPGFSATFMVPATKTGQSTIRFTSSVSPVALGGRVQYQLLYQKYAPFSRKGQDVQLTQNLTIDWSSPAFAAEIPISLEAVHLDDFKGTCLTVQVPLSLMAVKLSHCQLKREQLWGFDKELRLHSLLSNDHCLTREPDDSLSLRSCNHSSTQKWQWMEKGLLNNQGGYLSVAKDGSLYTSWSPSDKAIWHGLIRKANVADTLTIQSDVST